MNIGRLPRAWEGVLTLLLLTSIGLNFMLARRVERLKAVVEIVKDEQRLQVGATVPPLEAKTLDGKTVLVSYNRPTIVYVLLPSCHWCKRNTANINALASAVESKYDIVGISLTSAGLAEHLSSSGYKFPVLTELSSASLIALKTGGTPQTVVLSTGGKVLRSWDGAFGGSTVDEVQAFFGARLPGLVTPQKLASLR